MDYEKIRRLIQCADIPATSEESGVPLRTLFRFRAGGTPTLRTLGKLETWAKGRRLPRQKGRA